ncbi:MAG: hypothetical protein PHZ19_11615 [Candidatus Thermoplasmatota archaeon]|nr:hypothetical protein [Candidatus Thermoplasmatota archaeon]
MMDGLRITTNGHPRPILYGWELTDEEKEEFDHLDDDELDEHDFVRYKGQVYDLGEFERIPVHRDGPLFPGNWSGYHPDSFFSGILVRYLEDDDDNVVMGWYLV